MIRSPKYVLVSLTDKCEHGANFAGLAAATLWGILSAGNVSSSWSTNDKKLRIFDDCVRMSTGHDFYGTSLHCGVNTLDTSVDKRLVQKKIDRKVFDNSDPHAFEYIAYLMV